MTAFTLRSATLDDLPELIELFNRAAQEVGEEAAFTLAGYTPDWQREDFALADDSRVAVMDGGRLGGVVEHWSSTPYVGHWLWARVEPQLRGLGIGTALMQWGEARTRSQLALAPEGVKVACSAACADTDEASNALLRERGYALLRRSMTMERSLAGAIPQRVLPVNMTIRPMQPGEEAAVFRAHTEAFRDHRGFVEQPFEEAFTIQQQFAAKNPNYDPSLWFLAIDGEEIAGVVLCAPRHESYADAWVDLLGVRRPWRKQGLGLALLYHSFAELKRRGHQRVGLSVDAHSLTGATRLYERAGMYAIHQHNGYEKVIRDGTDLSTQKLR